MCKVADLINDQGLADLISDRGLADLISDQGLANLVNDQGLADLINDQGLADLISDQDLADLISDQGLADLISEQGLDFFFVSFASCVLFTKHSRQHKSMIIWCSQNAPRQQPFHMAPAVQQPFRAVRTSFWWIFKMC